MKCAEPRTEKILKKLRTGMFVQKDNSRGIARYEREKRMMMIRPMHIISFASGFSTARVGKPSSPE